jgi:hypothetical protein
LDPTGTYKYTEFLIKNFKRDNQYYSPNLDELKGYLGVFLFGSNEIEVLNEFERHSRANRIKEKDISKYDSWDMLEMELFEAKNKEMFKKSKKEISIIFEDENYLIFRPLSYMASCSYGYQTKWCTAMVNDASYFYSHSRGVLIYLIDKKENRKFAFHSPVKEFYDMDSHENLVFKTYNQEDKQIDTIQTGLPINIIKIILMEADTSLPTTLPNYKLFSEEEKIIFRKYNGYDTVTEELVDELPMPIHMGQPRLRAIPRLTIRRDNVRIEEDIVRIEETTEEYLTKCIVDHINEDNDD